LVVLDPAATTPRSRPVTSNTKNTRAKANGVREILQGDEVGHAPGQSVQPIETVKTAEEFIYGL